MTSEDNLSRTSLPGGMASTGQLPEGKFVKPEVSPKDDGLHATL